MAMSIVSDRPAKVNDSPQSVERIDREDAKRAKLQLSRPF
jgi:hypothetical protein